MFHQQTYPRAELFVLDERKDPSFLFMEDRFVMDSVRHEWAPGPMSLGSKRNLAIAASVGDIIMHWDDDDIYDAGRIEDQVRRLIDHDALVTGYNSMEFICADSGRWMYEGSPDYALGVSLCYRREFWQKNPFPDLNTGEDLAFVLAARKSSRFVCVPSNGMIIATIHEGNTSPRQTGLTKQWRRLAA